jgi:hypothetical protein
MSAYANDPEENLRRHWLGVAVLGVLLQNRQVGQFMDGDSVNRLADQCIADPSEPAIATLLASDFDAGFGVYKLAEWFPGGDAADYAAQIAAALHEEAR